MHYQPNFDYHKKCNPSSILFSDFFLSHGSRTDASSGARMHGKDLDKIPKRFLLHHPVYPSCISHHMSTALAPFLYRLLNARGASKGNQPVNPVFTLQTSQSIRITPVNLVYCLVLKFFVQIALVRYRHAFW